MRFSRSSTGTLFVGGALGLTLAALAYPAMLGVQTVSSSPTRIVAQTSTGPLTEADRDFVVKVRAAGLWEYPVGQMALAKGTSQAVLTAGQHLVAGHAALDATCRGSLRSSGSPSQPAQSATAGVRLHADRRQRGTQFDSDFANILRITHGSIFNTVAKIRSTTKNTLVRALADQANVTVLDHITVMEKTGLVNFDTALFQQTSPPKLPASDVTPPVPVPGAPTVVLTPPPDTGDTPSPSPTAG